MSIRAFYDRWPQYDRRLTNAIRDLTPAQLATRHGLHEWPIWATVGHTAAARPYWLCAVAGQPLPDDLPFAGGEEDWADDLDHPRTAPELTLAMRTTFAIVDRLLDDWTPEMLSHEVERWYGEERQVHSRASILQRLMTHEAWHAAEISETLGRNGLPEIDLWRPD